MIKSKSREDEEERNRLQTGNFTSVAGEWNLGSRGDGLCHILRSKGIISSTFKFLHKSKIRQFCLRSGSSFKKLKMFKQVKSTPKITNSNKE